MTKTTSRHLLDILAEVPNFRNNRGKRALECVNNLSIVVCVSMKIMKFHSISQ